MALNYEAYVGASSKRAALLSKIKGAYAQMKGRPSVGLCDAADAMI
jgi:hypothetical protein